VLTKRSFSLSGHRTSVALETEFWDVLQGLATSRGQGLAALVASIDAGRTPAQSLASALRLAALRAAYDKPVVGFIVG
jgi:predicted DNA-binding ribbon-helix-helix protein